jgi:hypothetical protein
LTNRFESLFRIKELLVSIKNREQIKNEESGEPTGEYKYIASIDWSLVITCVMCYKLVDSINPAMQDRSCSHKVFDAHEYSNAFVRRMCCFV